jgi:hypothetical protein
MYHLDFHPLVETDFAAAVDWYELQQAGLSDKFLIKLKERLQTITNFPETYSAKFKKGYREAKLDSFPYMITYKVYKREKRILIVSLVHERMLRKRRYRL